MNKYSAVLEIASIRLRLKVSPWLVEKRPVVTNGKSCWTNRSRASCSFRQHRFSCLTKTCVYPLFVFVTTSKSSPIYKAFRRRRYFRIKSYVYSNNIGMCSQVRSFFPFPF